METLCFSELRWSLAEGCPPAAQSAMSEWRNYGFSLLVLVTEEQQSKQTVQALSSVWVSKWFLAFPTGLHTASSAEEWAARLTTGRKTGAHKTQRLCMGKGRERRRVACAGLCGPALGLTTQREGLFPIKLPWKFLMAKSHMEPRAILFPPQMLTACFLILLFFHQPA